MKKSVSNDISKDSPTITYIVYLKFDFAFELVSPKSNLVYIKGLSFTT